MFFFCCCFFLFCFFCKTSPVEDSVYFVGMNFALAFWMVLTTWFNPSLSLVDHQVPVFQHVEEWHSWKTTHGRRYNSHLEELEKHLTWLSNKAFIEQHNINADNGLFSYKMKLNHLADLVRQLGYLFSFSNVSIYLAASS